MLRPSMLKLARSDENRISPVFDTDLIDSNPETEPLAARNLPAAEVSPSMPPVPLPRMVRSAAPEIFPALRGCVQPLWSIPFTEASFHPAW